MDGIHDLGGRDGFGPVVVEPDEPVFHEPWERTARALITAVMGVVPNPGGGPLRHTIERMDPGLYLTSTYYEHWLTAAATLAVEAGIVTLDELEARAGGVYPLCRPEHPAAAAAAEAAIAEAAAAEAVGGRGRFAVGSRVRVRRWHPHGHTRCPSYVMGHIGVITRADGAFSVPDIEAHSTERIPEATYAVRFEADELWADGQPGVVIHVDLWDRYLEPA
jgi:nitrile hydratase subunit beta